ncbi:MAG: SCO family protein [Acidobacteriota bacterium]
MTWRFTPSTDRRGLVPSGMAVVGALACLLCAPVTGQEGDPHRHHRLPSGPPPDAQYTRTALNVTVPDVPVVDAAGRSLRLHRLLDRPEPLLLQFVFTTCPGVCPALSAMLSSTQRQLGEERSRVPMVSITIDPEHDTPERLATYAQRFGAEAPWLFLTGELDDVVAVQKAFGAYRGNKMRHEPLTFLRPAPGPRWLRYEGLVDGSILAADALSSEDPAVDEEPTSATTLRR